MRILIIGSLHKKNDKRVFRTVKALSKKNEVLYQYWTDNKKEKRHIEGNIEYIPVFYRQNLKINVLKKIKRRLDLDSFFLGLIKNEDYDIVYFHHYITTAMVKSFKIAKNRGKKVVYDLHELHPENFMKNLKYFAKVFKEKILWIILKRQLSLSDKVIFVSKEMKEYIFFKLGFDKDFMILKNYAEINFYSDQKEKVVAFVGGTVRGIDKEINLLDELINKGFSFEVIGNEVSSFKNLEHKTTGFLPYKEMMREISKVAFSLVSFSSSKNIDYKNDIFSLPNKYFDSIAAGTPVIVNSKFISMVNEIIKYGIGVIINPENVEESIEKIENAYENYEEMMKNIKKYKHEFVWTEEIEKDFVDFVVD